MRHGVKTKKFNRPMGERKSLYRNLIESLFLHERIVTTKQKAKVIRPIAEKLITKARKQTLSARRQVSSFFYTEEVAYKLYHEIAPRFKERAGGYLRILKLSPRKSDNADMAIIELVQKAAKKKKADVVKKTTPKAEKTKEPSKAEKVEEKK